jgi:hypothetical protein
VAGYPGDDGQASDAEGDAVRPMIVLYILLAAGSGALVVVQASINGELRGLVGDPYRTALF